MNKGLEVIEAYWLFGFDVEKNQYCDTSTINNPFNDRNE